MSSPIVGSPAVQIPITPNLIHKLRSSARILAGTRAASALHIHESTKSGTRPIRLRLDSPRMQPKMTFTYYDGEISSHLLHMAVQLSFSDQVVSRLKGAST
jgi:hypothetical protein